MSTAKEAQKCVFWCAADTARRLRFFFGSLAVWSVSFLGEKSSKIKRLLLWGACVTSSFQSYLLFFHYETHTFRDTDTHSITKNDDDDADDDARDDDDAVFVFVFWKKQQKEPFDDDDHYGEEQR